ncbi:MAG: PAS domain S-box protein [Desulfobulbaceae bacterium]|nr:PAS domain S-box protein [Desulfobulbaceae bacterium]
MGNKKKSITRGTIYAFAILLGLYGLHATLATRAMHELSSLTRTVHNHPLVVSNASLQANVNIIKIHRSMKDVVLSQDTVMIQSTLANIAELETKTINQLQLVQKNILGNKGQTIVSEALTLFDKWAPIRADVIVKVENGDRELAAQITYTEGAAHVAKLEEQVLELSNYARNKASGFLTETENVYNHVRSWSILLFAIWGVLSVGVALFTIRRTLRGERELADEKEKLNVTLRSIGDGVIATDPNGRITLLNEVAEELTGWREGEAQGQSIEKVFAIINEITRIPCENPVARVIETNGIIGLANHTILIAKDGIERAIADSAAPIRNEKQEIIGVVLVFRDQTEERNYQDKISRNEEKYRLLSNNTLDVIWTMNLDLQFTYINKAVNSVTGHTPEEWVGSHLADHCDTKNFTIMEESIRQELAKDLKGVGVLFEAEMLKKNGEPMPVEVRGRVLFDKDGRSVGFQGVSRDISERKTAECRRDSLEKQLIQAQKMESVGRLAGGVAHDFNNMLNVIMGYTELMLEKTQTDSSMQHDLLEIQGAAQRSTEITRQLLAFARQQTIAPKVLDLNDAVENMLKMLRRLIGEDIDLVWLPDVELSPIKIDPTQIDQIMANLCVNARDALVGVGEITIETKSASFDESYCKDHMGFTPGEYVLLTVSDDGSGMDKKTQENIFEPFFTTKDIVSGTGLGLSMVYGIVKQNHGFINVYSELEKGTTIKIYLPRYASEMVSARKVIGTDIPHGRGETVLIVEDEAAILKLGKRMLETLGYTVIDANSPEKAIEMAASHAGKIQLLITDVVMPGMNGRQLANHLKAIDGDLKVMFMSGYTADVIANRGVLDDDVCFMQKPFSQTVLANKAREALAE